MTLIHEIIKNLKIIIRDSVSVTLFLVAPLTTIMLIGYIFGSDQIHDIKMGLTVIHPSPFINELVEQSEDSTEIIRYDDLSTCINDLKRSELHICLNIVQEFNPETGDLIRGTLEMHSDPSRGQVTWRLVDRLSLLVETSSYDISIQSTEGLLDTLGDLVLKLKDRKEKLEDFIVQLESFRRDFISKRNQLIRLRGLFGNQYDKLQTLQGQAESEADTINILFTTIEEQITTLSSAVKTIEEIVQQSDEQLSSFTPTTPIPGLDLLTELLRSPEGSSTLDELGGELPADLFAEQQAEIDRLQQQNRSLIDAAALLMPSVSSLENAVLRADEALTSLQSALNTSRELSETSTETLGALDSEIANTQSILVRIDDGLAVLRQLNADLGNDIDTLSIFDPSFAENLLRPLSKKEIPITELSGLSVWFANLLFLVIIFISIIFANIIALGEIHSPAHIRSVIAPASNVIFIFGAVITNIILVLFQVTIFFLVAQFQFGVDVISHLSQLYLISILVIAPLTFVGILIAYMIRREQISVLLTTFSAVILFFLSSTLFPLEAMPIYAAYAAGLNPISIGTDLARVLVTYDINIWEFPQKLLLLGFYILVMSGLTMAANKRFIRRLE